MVATPVDFEAVFAPKAIREIEDLCRGLLDHFVGEHGPGVLTDANREAIWGKVAAGFEPGFAGLDGAEADIRAYRVVWTSKVRTAFDSEWRSALIRCGLAKRPKPPKRRRP